MLTDHGPAIQRVSVPCTFTFLLLLQNIGPMKFVINNFEHLDGSQELQLVFQIKKKT